MPGLTDLIPLLFEGTSRIIAVSALLIGGLLTWWVLANETQRKKIKILIFLWPAIILAAGLAMVICNYIVIWKNSFPKGTAGVLVLSIVGDEKNSLQCDLISSLRDELMKAGFATNISIRASDKLVDDTKLLNVLVAHKKARAIGQQLNAQIVVWGNRTGEKKFWPRITIVKPNPVSPLAGERQLYFQVIDQINPLPATLVDEPVYLAFFLAGLSSYSSGQYDEALNAFESASKYLKSDSPDIAPLKFFTANCHFFLAQTQNQPKKFLSAAIEELQFALKISGRTKSPLDWAATQNNLGAALFDQARRSQGAEAVRLWDEAVTACRAALEVYTREQFPQDWAWNQNNLGNALLGQAGCSQGAEAIRLLDDALSGYLAVLKEVNTCEQLPQLWTVTQNNLGNALRVKAMRSEGAEAVRLLDRAVAAYRVALEVRTREQFPQVWAMTQGNLGNVLRVQAEHCQGTEAVRLLSEAVAAYRAALEVYTRERFPQYWAATQNSLGAVLRDQAELSEGAEAVRLLGEAAAAFRAALEVNTREQFPQDWAATQNDLGVVLRDQAERSQEAESVRLLSEVVATYRAALEVNTREQFPQEWAATQNNLGRALRNQAGHSQGDEAVRLLSEAVSACRAALEVSQLPQDWAATQGNLGNALRDQAMHSQGTEAVRLLGEAVVAYRAALVIFTVNEFPRDHDLTMTNLARAEEALRRLQSQ